MNEFFRFKYFIKYQWCSKTKYYLHSPFVYQFYLNILEGQPDNQLQAVQGLRKKLSNDQSYISIQDLGTGKSTSKKISELECKVAVREKYGNLLYRLVKYFKPSQILELGTSAGISSSYMALANEHSIVNTFEGSPELIELAKKNHSYLGIKNISYSSGDFSKTLPDFLAQQYNIGLVFFDGNHRKESTLNYFNQCIEKADVESIFVFDDIYWSKEMN